jgi:tRNA(Ile)-lysidine synthase
MLEPGEHVLVAVSGGADSMALLICMHDLAPRMDLKLTVAHLNHCLRGAEANEDEEFVQRASARLGWPFVSACVDVRARAAADGRNLEEAAREARYEFLRKTAARVNAGKIATGHTLNDQAETVLLRLMRGSGPGGLGGIHAVSGDRLIRPLIECGRAQVLEFLSRRQAEYREDATNQDLHYRRNRVRHELMPYLEKHFNPRLVETLAREASFGSAIHDFLETQASLHVERLRIPIEDGIAMPAQELFQLHPALRHQIVRRALRELLGSLRGIRSVHIEEILQLCGHRKSGKRIELPRATAAMNNLGNLELRKGKHELHAEFRYELPLPGRCRIPEAELEIIATVLENPFSNAEPRGEGTYALLDLDALPATLTVRSRLPGDRYGGSGHRKVKKMLLAARIPSAVRITIPMVVAGEAVIWIPGFKPAKLYRADAGFRRSVFLEARRVKSGNLSPGFDV